MKWETNYLLHPQNLKYTILLDTRNFKNCKRQHRTKYWCFWRDQD